MLSALVVLAWGVYQKLDSQHAGNGQHREKLPVPVEVALVERGSIEQLRSFTGTLEARSEFVVAPKIAGRIELLKVDLADGVNRRQVVLQPEQQGMITAHVIPALQRGRHFQRISHNA